MCRKFKANPLCFFSEPPCQLVLKSLDLEFPQINDGYNTIAGSSQVNPFKNLETECGDSYQINKTEENSPNKIASKKFLKEMINNIQIDEKQKKIDKSNQEDSNDESSEKEIVINRRKMSL